MEISLRSIDFSHFTDSERAIFNVLRVTLQYPANPQVKGAKLADDISFFLLIRSLDNLRQRDDLISDHGQPWKELPNLSFSAREQWSDPTVTGEGLSEEFAKWKNLNSFVARLTSTGFAPWLHLPIWQLRTALEEPPVEGSAMECRLWVASEWIIYCADPIFKYMTPNEELDEGTARALRTGTLCDGKSPLGVERWGFWKKRFSKFAADASGLKLDSAITGRISNALNIMDAVE
ncbi:uncharacterized protein BP5553_06585 [Venustampulla echinocandica]|uniref:Uncharacterized protein n=1 Tax=Venustampulla echinocandica TaxID=2656787 RepID=A0A370TKD1_9HELO|nr:uncharacterized protein BP5553_06585 [Venustampulla echinocandica]RDL35973.1 hypothetical protein BP5553_06585 [Venustampulla echinocandica]